MPSGTAAVMARDDFTNTRRDICRFIGWVLPILVAYVKDGATGCIALLFAFSIGAIWLRLYEQNDSIMHVIQWHYLPMIVFGIIGLWLGKLILKW